MAHTFGQLQRSLERFLGEHLEGLENEERVEALFWYCQGLGLELPQKNVAAMASRLRPDGIEGVRQRMQRAISRGRFSHDEVFNRLQGTVFRTASDKLEAIAIDDTGIAKKGRFSPGVQRQYSGTLGKIDNCQIVVTLHGVSDEFSACLDAELFLPERWVDDESMLEKAKVPEDRRCVRTKTEIALEMLQDAHARGAPNVPVVADAGYGDSRDFREGIRTLGWHYAVAVSSNTTIWPPGAKPKRPKPTGQRGRPPSFERDPNGKVPIRVDRFAQQLWDAGRFRTVTWRTGSKGVLRGQFCARRIHSAEGRTKNKTAGEPIWLLIHRDPTLESGFRFFLSSLPSATPIKKLARIAKIRWRIERDYQDMKQKLGFDKYEGRTWGGLHRHLAMSALVHAFLSLYREDFSPRAHNPMEVDGLLSCPDCRADALGWEVPNLSAGIR